VSDSFVVLIPADPRAEVPSNAVDIRDQLSGLIGATEARIKDFGARIQFIDCGENFVQILCPACGQPLDTGWWGHQMDHCWNEDAGFSLHAHAVPCCGADLRLDELVYDGPQGFARWFISARAGDRARLQQGEIDRFEAAAGLKLRQILQRY
jgi:hypothetical protein